MSLVGYSYHVKFKLKPLQLNFHKTLYINSRGKESNVATYTEILRPIISLAPLTDIQV